MAFTKNWLKPAIIIGCLLFPAGVWAQNDLNDTFAIANVRVFDGEGLSEPKTVVVENGVISDAETAEIVVDGAGCTLLPGLIDAHVHLDGRESLEQAAYWGVTTMLDMGTPMSVLATLRDVEGLYAILGSGVAAAPAGGAHAAMGCIVVSDPASAKAYIAERVCEKVDYIKVIVDSPSNNGLAVMDEGVLAALVSEAHEHNLRVVAHVTQNKSVNACFRTGVDVITHLPIVETLETELATKLKIKKAAAIPTLVMMLCVVANTPMELRPATMDFQHAASSLMELEAAGVTIMAGTDANSAVCLTPHGESLHEELFLMAEAGLSPAAVLRSATITTAKYFGLDDRGVIAPGYRADLLLVIGDPTIDITAAQNIVGVWIAGQRVR